MIYQFKINSMRRYSSSQAAMLHHAEHPVRSLCTIVVQARSRRQSLLALC
jgi:hypothetical protein